MHEGLALEFAPHKAGAAEGTGHAGQVEEGGGDDAQGSAGGDSSSWQRGLDALSGGQRTMASLALVVAVRGGGSSLQPGPSGHPSFSAATKTFLTERQQLT